MNKTIGVIMAAFITTSVMAGNVKLPVPDKSNTATLIQALENRHSDHEFSDKVIDQQTLSTILWVAYGVNRPDDRRTIPTAMNKKDLNIYVFNNT